MSEVADSPAGRTTVGAVVLWGIGAAASIVVALAIAVLGYVDSLLFGIRHGVDFQQGPNGLLWLAAVWGAAAAAELVCAVLAKRRFALAASFVSLAMVVPLAVSLLAADNTLARAVVLLAWLVPAVPLVLGVVAALSSVRRRTAT